MVEEDSLAVEDRSLVGVVRSLGVEEVRIPAVVVRRSWVVGEGSRCVAVLPGMTVLEKRTWSRRYQKTMKGLLRACRLLKKCVGASLGIQRMLERGVMVCVGKGS